VRHLGFIIFFVITGKKYLANLSELGKVLKNRNKLLFRIKTRLAKEDELNFWDEKLIENGKAIIGKREKVIKVINEHIAGAYDKISGASEKLELKYHPSAKSAELEEMLAAHRDREIAASVSMFGPHRDDLVFLLNGKDLATFGSRGEFRTAILALKIAEWEYLKLALGKNPILLLDDIFSELDESRRSHLVGIIGRGQTIITTTDLDNIEKGLQKSAKIIELHTTEER
jgi:DNA replication and repair protein RecF